MQHENPHWSKVRNSVKASKALKAEGKKKEKKDEATVTSNEGTTQLSDQ